MPISLTVTTLFFAAGLAFSFYFHTHFTLIFLLLAFFAAVQLAYFLKNKFVSVSIFFSFVFLLGIFMGKTPFLPPPKNHIARYAEKYIAFTGTLLEAPKFRNEGLQIKANCNAVAIKKKNHPCTGVALIYVTEKSEHLHQGDTIRVRGTVSTPLPARNPGEFSYKIYLLTRGIRSVVYADSVEKIKSGRAFSFKRLSFALRDRFVSVYNHVLPRPYNLLLTAFIFGSETAELSDKLNDDFRKAGIIHLMVASGAQIAILLMACFYFNKLTAAPSPKMKIIAALISFVFILAYTFMTQAGFSILRAFFMGSALLLSVIAGRDYDALSALFFSALLILILHPLALLDAGFQLSFAATFGIIYLSPKLLEQSKRFIEKPSRLTKIFLSFLAATLSAQLFVTPVILFYFNGISAFSLISNLLCLPLAALLVPLGFLTGIAGGVSLILAKILASFCGFFLFFILLLAQQVAAFPYGFIECARPSFLFITAYYFILFVLCEKEGLRKNIPVLTWQRAAFITAALLFFIPFAKHLLFHPRLKVVFFDIGQGDSMMIQTPDGAHILIDGGGGYETHNHSFDPGKRVLLPYFRREGIRQLDLVVLTHPHRDHLLGLLAVLRERKVRKLLYSSLECNEPFCAALREIVKEKRVQTLKALRGMKFSAGRNIKLLVLNPPIKHLTDTASDIDNNSVAILLTYKHARFLLAGDIYKDAEESILKGGINFTADVLKVAHHGSRHSSTLPFLRFVHPVISIISCGRHNVFHHPSPDTIKNLKQVGSKVYRTDLNGAAVVESDGSKIWASTMY